MYCTKSIACMITKFQNVMTLVLFCQYAKFESEMGRVTLSNCDISGEFGDVDRSRANLILAVFNTNFSQKLEVCL